MVNNLHDCLLIGEDGEAIDDLRGIEKFYVWTHAATEAIDEFGERLVAQHLVFLGIVECIFFRKIEHILNNFGNGLGIVLDT